MSIDLPLVFTALMGLAILAYTVLDGYDLGVGMLLPAGDREEQAVMVASIGPFWDANETWLVLGVGLLLVAFPAAHGIVLGALYLPVAAMLVGLMLRGAAFEFRVKALGWHRELWNWLFWFGSFLASLAQGFMLGRTITGYESGFGFWLFSLVVAGGLCGSYMLLGATWLILRTEGALQRKAIGWARWGLAWVALGEALAWTVLVTGHGGLADREYLAFHEGRLRSLTAVAEAAHRAGTRWRDVVDQVPPPRGSASDGLARAFAQLDGSL